VWLIFFVLNILINGTIQFALGADMHAWKDSSTSNILFGFVQYGIMFTVVPLILIKSWETVRQSAFLIPLCIALAAITFALVYRGVRTKVLALVAERKEKKTKITWQSFHAVCSFQARFGV
jgi:hypothetical protein